MNNLTNFNFRDNQIRVVELEGKPWFVARDLYLILFGTTTGINARTTVSSDETRLLEGDDFSVSDALKSLRPLRGRPRLALLSESGLYKLVMRSDKPEARVFQDWVTREVLPAIRKDGAYVMGEEKVRSGDLSEDEFILRAFSILQKKVERLTAENAVMHDELNKLTVDEYRALNHLYWTHAMRVRVGQRATYLCMMEGIEVEHQVREVPLGAGRTVPRQINVYPRHILDKAVEHIKAADEYMETLGAE